MQGEHTKKIKARRKTNEEMQVSFSVRSRRLFAKLAEAWMADFKPSDKHGTAHNALHEKLVRLASSEPMGVQQLIVTMMSLERAIGDREDEGMKDILGDICDELVWSNRALLPRQQSPSNRR